MNTRQLKYVLILARERSFSKAADVLNISQPSLSQYIKKIETEVGLELFDRTNGEVRLTDAGKVYIDTGRQILDLEHQMEAQMSDLAQRKTGSLLIGSSPYRAAGMMPAIAKAFQEQYPGMHLVVREGTTSELSDGLEHGEYDAALTLLPLDGRVFEWEKVMEEELILAVPASEPPICSQAVPGRRYPAIDAAELNGRKMIMLTDTQFMHKQLENLVMDFQIDVFPAAVVKSLEAQIAMVRTGVGIALMPSGIERFCTPSEVRFYSFVQPLPRREVVFAWRKDRKHSQTVEDLKKIICSISW